MANYYFRTPTVNANPRYLESSSPMQRRLFRFFKPLPRGVNVFILQDGTVVQDTPTIENQNSNVPYPIGNPQNLVSRNWDPYGLVEVDTAVVNPVVFIYYGGHKNIVNQAQANVLIAAGYSGNLTLIP